MTKYIMFFTSFIISIILLICGFFAPPTGVIDNSILIGVGELFGFATLWQLPLILGSIKRINTLIGNNVHIDVDNTDK